MANLAGTENAMSQIELNFSGRNLKNMDWMSKSDPIVLVYFLKKLQNGKAGLQFIGQTERIDDNLNPDWASSVYVDYFFEEEQTIVCKVLDVDNDKTDFTDADFIGQTAFTLGNLVSSKGQMLHQKLKLEKEGADSNRGSLIIRAEEVAAGNAIVTMDMTVNELQNNSSWYNFLWYTPSPQLIIRKPIDKENHAAGRGRKRTREETESREDGVWVKVYESEVVRNSKDPKFKRIEMKSSKLCNGDLDRPLRIEVVDASSGTENAPILCAVENSINDLVNRGHATIPMAMANRNRSGGPCHGLKRLSEGPNARLTAEVTSVSMPSFLDYIKGGLELNLHVGIDFTASNLDVYNPESLHYMNPHQPNQYQRVIQQVGRVLQDYDSDKLYPVYGFGGKGYDGKVSHCFPLDPQGQEVKGIEGILQVYSNALKVVTLSGPTLFTPLLNNLISKVAHSDQSQSYNIMLILTDGCIHDMDNTISAVCRSSYHPISIIIVGIGDADFGNMDQLDADDGRLRSTTGEEQKHDNVQFVPFNEFQGSASQLSREVLRELPDQVVTHFMSRNIKPNPPRTAERPSFSRANTGLSPAYVLAHAATTTFLDPNDPSAPPPPCVPAYGSGQSQVITTHQPQWNDMPVVQAHDVVQRTNL